MGKIQKVVLKEYPDISDLLRAKEARRRELSERPIGQKLEMVRKMKEAALLIKSSKKIEAK